MNPVAWTFLAFFLVALTVLGIALGCNADLLGRERRAKADAKQARAVSARDRAEAAMLRKSNAQMRQHTAEHCQREAALKALLQAAGWHWVDVAPEHVDVSDLDAAVSPADISWVPGQRDGGA